ncbi:MAG TPA: AraC family transcriptional regulator [Lysobacter sp.]|nr:AraC family transcriptional regulator [Lysobacter sp.]
MNTATRTAHLGRIDRAVALLERAIADGGELPDLARLAEAAAFSPFHFHRVYRALTGETVGRTVARLRLLRGLRLLAAPGAAVTDAALAVGYETPQAFARAFREALGATPSELRRDPARIAAEMERLSRPPAPVSAAVPLRVEVVSVEPFRVAALRSVGPAQDLDQAYGRLFAWAGARGLLDRLAGLYGVPWSDRSEAGADCVFDCMLAFDAGFADDPDAGVRAQTLGGGRYARVRHVGPFAGLEPLIDRIIAEWLPAHGQTLRDAPIHEAYLDDPEHTPETLLRTDVFVPLG